MGKGKKASEREIPCGDWRLVCWMPVSPLCEWGPGKCCPAVPLCECGAPEMLLGCPTV